MGKKTPTGYKFHLHFSWDLLYGFHYKNISVKTVVLTCLNGYIHCKNLKFNL